MFLLYKMRLKCLFKNRANIFWCYLFPIILATCFFFAFGNLGSIDNFQTISIGYVMEDLEGEDPLRLALQEAKISKDTSLFNITFTDNEEAKTLLEDNKIEVIIVGKQVPELIIKENGLNETIVKSFLDRYLRDSTTIQTIMAGNPDAINQGLMDEVMDYDNFVKEVNKEKKPDSYLIYFFSLIAYTCIFAANWGLDEVINIQADQSLRGARLNISPIRKMKLFLINLSAGFTAHIGSLVLLFVYLRYILKVNFGDNVSYILLTCLVGSITGLMLGATVALLVRQKSEVKNAILTLVVLGGSFLSGMMIADMKYIVNTKFPILAYINPVNLVTDALYSLYYYDTYQRFFSNIIGLCIMTIILSIISYLGLRRKSYASL